MQRYFNKGHEMNPQYFVLSVTCDGTHLKSFDKEGLEAALAENYWGEDVEFTRISGRVDMEREGHYIIKGESIVPTAVEVVTKYEV